MTRPEKTTPIGESPSPHAEARRAFPAGLEQPEGSFRFSVDALLLAAFAASRTTDVTIRFIDLGTGCGVVGLAYLLLKRNICQGFGMDCNPELIAAAQNNTAKLGFSDRFALHTGELADTRFLENLRMEASPVQFQKQQKCQQECRFSFSQFLHPPNNVLIKIILSIHACLRQEKFRQTAMQSVNFHLYFPRRLRYTKQ